MTSIPLPHDPDRIASILGDERRRAIYLHVLRHHGPVTVNEVARRFDIHRNAAKFHLDKLLDAGLLRSEFKRVNGRRGPGAGRPSKLYTCSDVEVSFSIPERHYDLLAHLLLQALTSGEGLEAVGRRFGRETALTVKAELGLGPDDAVVCLEGVLERLGFHPSIQRCVDGTVQVSTSNCPFGRVAMEAPEGEVCQLDRAIVQGVLDAFGSGDVEMLKTASKRLGHDLCVREIAVGSTP